MRWFKPLPWLFSLCVVLLFGLGVVRMDSSQPALRRVDGLAGCFHDVARMDPTGRLDQLVSAAGQWVGAPPPEEP